MNKQLTVEELQDAKAYPLKTYRKLIGENEYIAAMQKDAALVRSKHKRNAAIPCPYNPTQESQDRTQLLIEALADGPMKPRDLFEHLSISTSAGYVRLKPLIEAGRVVRLGDKKNGKNVRYALTGEAT